MWVGCFTSWYRRGRHVGNISDDVPQDVIPSNMNVQSQEGQHEVHDMSSSDISDKEAQLSDNGKPSTRKKKKL